MKMKQLSILILFIVYDHVSNDFRKNYYQGNKSLEQTDQELGGNKNICLGKL